jgi:hypothetical protein
MNQMNNSENNFLENPLRFIQECVRSRKIYWTYHVNMRLRERSIPRSWILGSVGQYEVIESYPDDKYMPSYLVWSKIDEVIFHVLFAADTETINVRVVTAYRPDPEEWVNDMKKRRRT